MKSLVTELAWAAGFFDGEGSTCLSRNVPRIQVSQNELEPLQRFANAVGVGKITKRWRTNGFKDRWNYMYYASGGNCTQVIRKLWPYLSSIKRSQALRAYARIEDNPWNRNKDYELPEVA